MNSEQRTRWLEAAAEYVRLRDELSQKQAEMDAVRTTLCECVTPPEKSTQAIFLHSSLVVVFVERPAGALDDNIIVHVRSVIT